MLQAFKNDGTGLAALGAQTPLAAASWIDLYRPDAAQAASVEALGIVLPERAEMGEIEASNRVYTKGPCDYLTVVLPEPMPSGRVLYGPVTFILMPERLITLRYLRPKSLEGAAQRLTESLDGNATPAQLFVALFDEVVGEYADLMEEVSRGLDPITTDVFATRETGRSKILRAALTEIGRAGETVGHVRLGLLSVGRALAHVARLPEFTEDAALNTAVTIGQKDVRALEEHADFLSQRVSFATDATLGMINLDQTAAMRVLSVVAALFLPPTLIASIFGMNFADMGVLENHWGYQASLAAMAGSVLFTLIMFRWRRWI